MTRLTEEMVIARTRANDLGNIRKLNVWGSGLSDVTILRKMQNVEILSLSVNKIATLADFQWCRNLQELYVRRNEIRDLNQVCYLRDLPRLRSLWLDENPCSSCELYRVTVLRALPHLQKLDNVPVAPEEVQEALRRGLELCHPEDARASEQPQAFLYQQQAQQAQQAQQVQQQQRADSRQQSPARQERSPPRRHAPSDPDSEPEAQQPVGGRRACHDDLYYDTDRRNANYEPDTPIGYSRTVNNQYHNNIYDGDEERDRRPPAQLDLPTSQRCSPALPVGSAPQQQPLAPPGSRRPVPRNSNILSAVLCLIKELDFPSLEVVELAVKSRMEEF